MIRTVERNENAKIHRVLLSHADQTDEPHHRGNVLLIVELTDCGHCPPPSPP